MKFKSIVCSIFQTPSPLMIQKSMRHVDAFDDTASSSSGSGGNDYRIKREKNNESVRKSRAKNRVKLQECATHVEQLQSENAQLNSKVNKIKFRKYIELY